MTASFRQKRAAQNRIVLIAAYLGDHKKIGFNEILTLLSKAKRIEMLNAIWDSCLMERIASEHRNRSSIESNKNWWRKLYFM